MLSFNLINIISSCDILLKFLTFILNFFALIVVCFNEKNLVVKFYIVRRATLCVVCPTICLRLCVYFYVCLFIGLFVSVCIILSLSIAVLLTVYHLCLVLRCPKVLSILQCQIFCKLFSFSVCFLPSSTCRAAVPQLKQYGMVECVVIVH